ncbi:DNA-binding NarL/FixJ family response regulator [Chryseobacterium defluvii]|uniref:DNA-binding NarL/FixJ family response regulator n=1 Tax=Chryseobacterium defluvii TaxID=160396 RepID=A0A840KHB1_9FLAO|nr:response regulator [Chryseobacterium defluvii]MBB4807327.1 DNA-binding NarL/FixJ family response regulator [Chryseobacterium defluvii]
MFKKILIAEDQQCANLSVQKVLEELDIQNVDYVYYCDDALAKIQKSLRENNPYDLLITDLSFEEDHYTQNIKDGKELVKIVRQKYPDIKVIVFSGERSNGVVDNLFKEYQIDGFVHKARHDAKELKQAINAVNNNQKHLPQDLQRSIKKMNTYELSTYDLKLINLLAEGVRQKDIPEHLQNDNIKPNKLSSIEKRLNLIKVSLEVNSNEQLIALCKDLRFI